MGVSQREIQVNSDTVMTDAPLESIEMEMEDNTVGSAREDHLGNNLEIDKSHLTEETLNGENVCDHGMQKEPSSTLGGTAHNESNFNFSSFREVSQVCEEQDPCKFKNYGSRNLHRKIARTASTPTLKLLSIPSECLGFCFWKRANESILFLSLRPSGQIAFKGLAYIKCLLGSVNIAGYTLRQGEKVPLFACSPEVSLLVQGPEAVTMTSNPEKETNERHWINFFPKQADKEPQSQHGKVSRGTYTIDENFWTKWRTAIGSHSTAKQLWGELKLVKGIQAVVLEVTQFPISSTLDRVLCMLSDGEQRSLRDFMGVALQLPAPPRHRGLLPVAGPIIEREPFNESLYIPFSWRQVATCVCEDHLQQLRCHNQSGVRVMVIGGRSVGRSTFTRFLVNTLLSSRTSDSATTTTKASQQPPSADFCPTLHSTKKPSVYLMDLDPRHSKQSLPGTVSCARYTSPVLGPAFMYGVAHVLRRRSSPFPEWRGLHYSDFNNLNFEENPLVLPEIVKEFLIGRVDLSEIAEEYLAATAVLVDAHRSQCDGEPLVVNCTSANSSKDFDNILEVMRLVNPTHVVHIEGKINHATETSPFNCDRANEELGRPGRFRCDVTGAYTSDIDPDRILPVTEKLSYAYARIPSLVPSMNACKVSQGYTHDFTIASYFSALWPHSSPSVESESLQRCVISSCHDFAVHVRHEGVHYSQLLNSINCAGLVSLCYIDPRHIKKLGDESYSVVEIQSRGRLNCLDTMVDKDSNSKGPPLKRLKHSAPTCKLPPFNGDRLFRVHGWAVVKGVNPVDKTIHLLIPGCASVLTKINCIVQSDVQLPAKLRSLFYTGNGNLPYESFVEQGPRNTKVKQRTNKKH